MLSSLFMSLVGRETLVAPDDTWSLLMVMCVAVAISIYLEQKYMWASKISGAIIAPVICSGTFQPVHYSDRLYPV